MYQYGTRPCECYELTPRLCVAFLRRFPQFVRGGFGANATAARDCNFLFRRKGNDLPPTKAAEKIGISAHTLRFYDKEGLLPNVGRDEHSNRRFTDNALHYLKAKRKNVKCQIAELKRYLNLLEYKLAFYQKAKALG